MGLGGWAISEQCFEWMIANVPAGSKVLEFGSGMGTGELVKHFDMVLFDNKFLCYICFFLYTLWCQNIYIFYFLG